MAFSISDFRSSGLKQSGARPNLFDVAVVGAPDQGSDVKSTEFTMLCKIASVPTSTVGVIEVPYFGRMVKIPGNRTFDNLSITIPSSPLYVSTSSPSSKLMSRRLA